jgi:hypothetical protein
MKFLSYITNHMFMAGRMHRRYVFVAFAFLISFEIKLSVDVSRATSVFGYCSIHRT